MGKYIGMVTLVSLLANFHYPKKVYIVELEYFMFEKVRILLF